MAIGACPGDWRGHGINWIIPALSLIDPSWGGNLGFLSIFSVLWSVREVRSTHVICKLAVKYFVWYNKSVFFNPLCITLFSFEGNVKWICHQCLGCIMYTDCGLLGHNELQKRSALESTWNVWGVLQGKSWSVCRRKWTKISRVECWKVKSKHGQSKHAMECDACASSVQKVFVIKHALDSSGFG